MLVPAAAELPSEVCEPVPNHCSELGIEYKAVAAACLGMELKNPTKHLVLSLVSLILDLSKYVVLEDGMGGSK